MAELEPEVANAYQYGDEQRDSFVASLSEQAANDALLFQQASYDECLAALSVTECPAPEAIYSGELFTACGTIFVGTRQQDEGCASNGECGSVANADVYCNQPDSDTCGVCATLPGVNESCGGADYECADGLLCNEDSICVTPSVQDEPCVYFQCAEGFICNESEICTAPPVADQPCVYSDCAEGFACDDTNTCVTAPGSGLPCLNFQCAAGLVCNANEICSPLPGVGEDCLQFQCAEGLFCNDTTLKCEESGPPPTPVENGPCTDNTCSPFVTGLYCDVDTNLCKPIQVVLPGETCEQGFEVGLYCRDQASLNICADVDGDGTFTCTARATAGNPCIDGSCAANLVCGNDDICADPPGDGEPCVNGNCASGFFCTETDLCAALPEAGEPCGDFGCGENLVCDEQNICQPYDSTALICPA